MESFLVMSAMHEILYTVTLIEVDPRNAELSKTVDMYTNPIIESSKHGNSGP